jgi:hypothetical protein
MHPPCDCTNCRETRSPCAPPGPPGCRCLGAPEPAAPPSTGRYSRATAVPFLEMRTFNFSNLSGTTQEFIVLNPRLCVLDYYRVRLSVRVHALTMAATQGLRFILNGTLPSEEDPALDFVSATDFLTLDIDSTYVSGGLASRSTTDPEAYLKISLRATQSSAPATFIATLSACLILRDF